MALYISKTNQERGKKNQFDVYCIYVNNGELSKAQDSGESNFANVSGMVYDRRRVVCIENSVRDMARY